MILSALLAATLATPALCPGDLSYHREVSRAARLLKVDHQLYVEVVNREDAPLANSKTPQRAVAWLNRAPKYDSVIRIRYDMLHAMSCVALRISAFHEVCHISLKHHEKVVYMEEAFEQEKAADACSKKFFSQSDWDTGRSDLNSAYHLAERERILPKPGERIPSKREVPMPWRWER